MNKVSFHKQGQVFKPRLWLTTSQTFLDCPPTPSRTHTTPPGTFSRLYVLVLCLFLYAILNRDLHDYSSQL